VTSYPEPTDARASRTEYYVDLLDFARARAIAKVAALSPALQASSALPSGWTPLALLQHLTYVEMRWLEWGFEGASVAVPFADRVDGTFHVDAIFADLASALERRGVITSTIVRRHALDEIGQPSERWEGAPPPTLERILQHLAFEYARHLGHLDIVTELATGEVGD
jgi:hypothetical protein